MKTTFRISDIIYRSLDGEITDTERAQLDAWLADDPGHRDLYKKMSAENFLREQDAVHNVFDVEKGYKRFIAQRNRIKRKISLSRWSAAAAILLLAGTALWFANREKDKLTFESIVEQAGPGQPGATLILATGQTVRLDGNVYTTIEEQNVNITVSGDRIHYEGQEAHGDELLFNTIITPRGGEYSLTLSDGTRAWLSADTRIEYPAAFACGLREVYINGEAYFEVAKDPDRPFIVNTGNMKLQVLGTSFNVRAYAGQTEQATLISGSVKATAGINEKVLIPGDQLNLVDDVFEMRKISVDAYRAWKTERFIFQDDHLGDVMMALERWYDIPIVVQDNALRELRFTGNLPKYENMQDVLRKLELTTSIRFEEKNGRVNVLSDR